MTARSTVASLATTRALPIALDVRGADAASAEQLATLIDRSGLDHVTVTAGAGKGRGVLVSAEGAAPEIREQRRWHVRGLRGVLRAMHAELDLVVVAPATFDGRIEALAPALQLAANREQGRLHIVAEPTDHGIARALQNEARRLGVVRITRGDLATTVASLVEQPRDFDVVLATGGGGRVLASAASALAGTRTLLPRLVARGRTVTAAVREHSASGLLLATVRVLEGLGFRDAPRALENAWLCALEEGLEHEGLGHVAPYTHRLDDAAFLAGVAERMGRAPKSLVAAVDRSAERLQPRLRLV